MDPNWLTGIGTLILALATFVLAGISVWSVRKNNAANRIFREETERLQRKERERLGKLQALDIISNWADEGDKRISVAVSLQSATSINDLLIKLSGFITEYSAVSSASRLFDERLQGLVEETWSNFIVFKESLNTLKNSYAQNQETALGVLRAPEVNELKERAIDNHMTLLNSIFKLQAYVRRHKISILF